ncbi:hypothetical protein I4F81_011789 [Pyropia yezoensis]|uniref:Uncharacterized protein n=1 Tax=Pyropia yezoensis TaxID=2788 RepID=A0ACC3CGD0_PYRYE|nr:hypothetical protein I4F81_011789 [Neopyropia yezoensis]
MHCTQGRRESVPPLPQGRRDRRGLSKVGVVERRPRAQPAGRIPREQPPQQVQADAGEGRPSSSQEPHPQAATAPRASRAAQAHLLSQTPRFPAETHLASIWQRPHSRPNGLGRAAEKVIDLGEGGELPLPVKERCTGEELGKNAAYGPHVNGRGIGSGAQEELWCPVPEGDHPWRQGRQGVPIVAGQPKVGHLEDDPFRGGRPRSGRGKEEVGRLQVPVQHPMVMKIGHR